MCRSIKTLRSAEEPPTQEEIHAAALQFVRKISGYRQPSKRNQEAFDAAVEEISDASRRLLDSLVTPVRGRQLSA
jgi:hypothetical protein